MLNFMKPIPACVSPGTGKNGSTVAVSYRSYVIRIIHHFFFGFFLSCFILSYLPSVQYSSSILFISALQRVFAGHECVVSSWSTLLSRHSRLGDRLQIWSGREQLYDYIETITSYCRLFSMVTLSCTCCCLVWLEPRSPTDWLWLTCARGRSQTEMPHSSLPQYLYSTNTSTPSSLRPSSCIFHW